MLRILLTNIVISLSLIGCTTTGPQTEVDKLDYKSRSTSRSHGAMVVSASVLSADESRDVYGVPLVGMARNKPVASSTCITGQGFALVFNKEFINISSWIDVQRIQS